MRARRGRPPGLRVATCECGKHITIADKKQKTVTCECGAVVTIGTRKPRASGVFQGYLETED